MSSIFICGLWCLYACLCLLISLVCVCVYSPSCLIFPHSLSAFIIVRLPKQLQPSQQAVRDSCSSTHAVWFYHTHVLLCSASLQSSCIYLMWNWAEQWHDVKAVVWWARWRVESSPRWPLSAGGGGGGGVSRGFDGVMDWCHSGQTCSAEVMISSRWWKRPNSNLFFWVVGRGGGLLLLISGIESWHRHFVVLLTATATFGHLICQLNSWLSHISFCSQIDEEHSQHSWMVDSSSTHVHNAVCLLSLINNPILALMVFNACAKAHLKLTNFALYSALSNYWKTKAVQWRRLILWMCEG